MKEDFEVQIGPCVSQVLETMFFTGVLACSSAVRDELDRSEGEDLPAAIDFHGPPDGTLCLCFRRETIATLAASFFGVESDQVTADDHRQVANELANMICGCVLSRCAPNSLFRLEEAQMPLCNGRCDTCVSIEMPEGRLNICARVDRL